jgi:hypothetical protein
MVQSFSGVDTSTPLSIPLYNTGTTDNNPRFGGSLTCTANGQILSTWYSPIPSGTVGSVTGGTDIGSSNAGGFDVFGSGYRSSTGDLTWITSASAIWEVVGWIIIPAAVGATATTLSGPNSGGINMQSQSFSCGVDLPTITGTVIVTPASDKSGTFSPTTVSLTTGTTPQTFKFTPTQLGDHSITTTNNGGLSNAATLHYIVQPYPLKPKVISKQSINRSQL